MIDRFRFGIAMSRKKRVCLTIAQKLKILNRFETSKLNKQQIANEFGIHRSSVSKLLKEKEKLLKVSVTMSRKTKNSAKYASEGG